MGPTSDASTAHVINARPDTSFQALEERRATMSAVYTTSVLAWDRQTHLPEGGVRQGSG